MRDIFATAGFAVRGLEAQGDWLAFDTLDRVFFIECKRSERPNVPAAIRQAEAECPQGVTPLVCWRRNREPWRVDLPLERFVELLAQDD